MHATTSTAPSSTTMAARLGAEALGTFSLVFGVIGAALFAAGFQDGTGGLNIGFLGVALALGLTVVGGAYAWGPISGGHFNPAVTIGIAVAGRFSWRLVAPYIVAQIVGGLAASSLLAAIAAGGPAGFFDTARHGGFASTGWGALSPGGFSLGSAFLVEVITTAVFVGVILSVTGPRGIAATAPLAIGLTLTLMALIAIPISNGSFNPARSIATAVWGGGEALGQLWMSLLAPTLGGVVAGGIALLITRSRPRVEDAPAPALGAKAGA
ncbi:aquaporin [Microbacterium sp. P05]|uniref:aquaporin n=1 Tax=Microbacterium sp. P05 TaxID=3366948 RepID=UPI0037471E8E